MTILYWFCGFAATYLLASVFLTYLLHRIPRRPVREFPEWGRVTDTRIAAADNGEIEVWRIEPQGISRGIVLLAHGWGRNRDRMVLRARIFGELGFTTVIHSARDHGKSSPKAFMNAFRFAEDIEAVLQWINEPVVLYGHSIGAAGAILAADRNRDQIRLLFLEGCYARSKGALRNLYCTYNRFFGIFFGYTVVFFMDILYRFQMDGVSPVRLAPGIPVDVLIIHGEKDENFPSENAFRLRDAFPSGKAELFIAKGSDHSSSSLAPGYREAIESFVERRFS